MANDTDIVRKARARSREHPHETLLERVWSGRGSGDTKWCAPLSSCCAASSAMPPPSRPGSSTCAASIAHTSRPRDRRRPYTLSVFVGSCRKACPNPSRGTGNDMDVYIGLDVSLASTAICVLGEKSKIVTEAQVKEWMTWR